LGRLSSISNPKQKNATPFTEPLKALEASRSQTPELLISDVIMPEINGIELAIQLLQICPECRVLLFSGQANTQGLLDTARASGNDFEIMSKPIHPSDLFRKVENGLGIAQTPVR
jgi:DNA-binding NtrC family response regulator